MHFGSHGPQGLIVRGLVDRPAGGFITSNINSTAMSAIINTNTGTKAGSSSFPAQTAARSSSFTTGADGTARSSSLTTGADGTARGSITGTRTGITQVGDRGDPQGPITGTRTGITSVGDRGDPQLIQQAGGMEAAAASAPAQLAALTELATQLQSDTNIALQDEAQQEAHRGLTNQLQALQRGIDMPNAQTNTTRDADVEVDVKETNSLADLGGAPKEQPTIDKGNQQQEKTTEANQGKANITNKGPDSTSSDEEVDWITIYKKARKKAKDQLQQRNKGAADVAWYEKAMKLMHTKKRSKR